MGYSRSSISLASPVAIRSSLPNLLGSVQVLLEKWLEVDQPGIYYGQCSELCGARHGYMPIAVEAVPMAQFNAWVLTQGGKIAGSKAPAQPAPAPGSAEPAPASAANGTA